MTSRIIAFVDGSVYAASVCAHAAWAARRLGASVDLVHMLGDRAPPASDLSGSLRLGARTALLNELAASDEQRARLMQAKGRAILEDARAILAEADVADVTMTLRHGDIVETVAAREGSADLLVMGKRGEAADFAKLHLGSNLERIVRASTRPILVAARAFRPVTRALIAFDGGPSAQKAVDLAARSPMFEGTAFRLVIVGDDTPRLRADLDAAAASLGAAGRPAEAELHPGQPDAVLSAMIEAEGFDLLVMGAYGHGRLRRLVIGSTTSEMLRSCKVSVVLTR